MRTAARLLGIAVALSACGGGQTRAAPFEPGWVDDHGAAMAAFERSFRGVRVPLGADVAVGVVGKEALVGVPLDGGAAWTFAHELHGRPALAGSVVVAAGGGELFALDARTGKLLWSRPSGGRIRGAGDDGVTTVVSLLPITGAGSLILAVARDGSVVRQLEDEAAIGAPAVVGDTAFFPWGRRFLSVYDLPSGEERARVTLRDDVSRVFAQGGALFAGERSFTRFDDRITLADGRGASTVKLPAPLGGLPGDPAWSRPGTDWLNRDADVLDKVRLYARPTTSGPASVEGGRFAATYFHAALGFDADNGALAWEHAHDAVLLGGAAYKGGFALCDEKGDVTFLDAMTGGVVGHASLGKPIIGCLVQADALTKPRVKGTGTLADQLAALAKLASPDELPLLRTLFASYRAPRSPGLDAAMEGAVGSIAEALLRLGARDPVAAAVSDPSTPLSLRSKLLELIRLKP